MLVQINDIYSGNRVIISVNRILDGVIAKKDCKR